MHKPGKIKQSLRSSFLDGIFSSSMTGLVLDYVTPYALALKATTSQIGMLTAAPNLASSLVQLKSADLTEKFKSRKRIFSFFVFLQAATLIPVILIPYFFKAHPVLLLIVFATLFTSFGAFAGPAWSSLMSEYVPYKMRGKYFGWRNKILAIVTVLAAIVSGIILHFFKNNIFRGFLIIFSLACLCRFVSWYFLTRMHEPEFRAEAGSYFSFLDFIKRVRESNFAKFVIFVASLTFCVNLAAPYFSVFMLRDLRFSYITYMILISAVTLANILTINRWGRLADKSGNLKIIRLTSFLIAFNPLFWIINRSPGFLIFAQIVGGFAWAGFNLCATNFIYDSVTPQKRVRCIAYFNVFSGVATCSGALLGGFLVNFLPPFLGYKILSLFLLASAARFIVVLLFSGKIKEVRSAENISSRDLFYSVVGIKPIFDSSQNQRQVVQEEE